MSGTGIKVDLVNLTGPLTPLAIRTWLEKCEDLFECAEYQYGKTLDGKMKVSLTGTKMVDPAAAAWWSEVRVKMKAAADWDKFASAVRDRFLPVNWKLDALENFYMIAQGSSSFEDFATRLQTASNALTNAGTGYTVSDSVMKNHLLFRAHPRLRRRVHAVPNLKYHDMQLDALTGLLSSTWASMVEEGFTVVQATPSTAATSAAPPTRPSLPPLTDAERDKLRDQKGCFHCRRHPGSPDWTPHGSRNCPGDSARGIQPRYISVPTASAVVGAVKVLDDSNNDDHTVYDNWGNDISMPAIFDKPPMSCVLSEDDESDFSDKV